MYLQRPTLVLNRNWQPVNVATVARALVLLWNESARVVDPADYQTVHLGRLVAAAPARRRAVHPGDAAAAARAGGDRADRATTGCRASAVSVQPTQHLQAGPLRLPVLRRPAGHATN